MDKGVSTGNEPSPGATPDDARVCWQPDIPALVERLRPGMDRLEEERQTALRRQRNAMFISFLCAGLGVVAATVMVQLGMDDPTLPVAFVLGALVIAWGIYQSRGASHIRTYRQLFKATAFNHAMRVIAPGMDYLPRGMIPQTLFERSDLFPSQIDSYEGEDLFSGKVGATRISFSELNVRKQIKTNKGSYWETVFEGIFMVVDFHKHFRCTVMIEPDFAEATFGFVGRGLQRLSGDLLRLENPDFERAFKVRAMDPVEARYLLTPDMQERFLALRDHWGADLRAAFQDSSLILALPKSGDWFEMDPDLPANDPEHLTRFIRQLLPLLHIPTRLDLDTRIWTKE